MPFPFWFHIWREWDADNFADTASAMPEEERKRFAAKAVKDYMKDV